MTKDMFVLDDHRSDAPSVPEVHVRTKKMNWVVCSDPNLPSYEPADPCATNLYYHLSFIQGCPRLDIHSRWLRLVEPKIVFWVGVHTDVRLEI